MKKNYLFTTVACLWIFLFFGMIYPAFSQSYETSFGPAPLQGAGPEQSGGNFINKSPLAGTNIYSYEGSASLFAYFDASAPGVIFPIVASPSTVFINAVEMVYGDPTKLFAIDHNGDAFKVDITSGTTSPLGNTGLINVLGIALNHATGTYYICDQFDDLYTIDMNTLSKTYIGDFGTSSGFMIGITCDGSGNLWGYDLATDGFYSINKTTGLATFIGGIGFDANYGQGLGYDPGANQVVMCAFNAVSFQAEYRSVNTSTGASSFIATIGTPGATQFSSCAIPSSSSSTNVPVSNWALFIGIGLILVFAVVRFRRMG